MFSGCCVVVDIQWNNEKCFNISWHDWLWLLWHLPSNNFQSHMIINMKVSNLTNWQDNCVLTTAAQSWLLYSTNLNINLSKSCQNYNTNWQTMDSWLIHLMLSTKYINTTKNISALLTWIFPAHVCIKTYLSNGHL